MSKLILKISEGRSKRQYKSSIVILYVIFLSVGGIFAFSGCDSANDSASSMSEPSPTYADETTSDEVDYLTMLVDNDPYLGPDDAPVVIVEFSDYLCPYCGKFYLETLPQILEIYPEQVKFVHRDYLLMGDSSYPALMAAGCALEQDRYWEMNDLLFSIYEGMDVSSLHHDGPPAERRGGGNPFENKFSDEKLAEYAQAIGLDMDAFTSCLSEELPAEEVLYDFEVAKKLGIRSIPVYFINGQAVLGFRAFEEFQPYIEQALAEVSG